MIKHFHSLLIFLLVFSSSALAQEKKVQNRPYTDLRPFHFGIHVGTHIQDIDFINVGPQMVLTEEGGTEHEVFISCDQDRIDPGFNVGVLGELRLSEYLQFRMAPTIYFGSRYISFLNHTESVEGKPSERRHTMKSAIITSSLDLIFAAPRLNNHRVYLMAGIMPALNLSGKSTDPLMLTRYQTFAEIGLGIDQYLPYFKCRPELKFQFGLGNALDMNHSSELRDKTMLPYANSVSKGSTKMITLSFYFE